MLILEAAVDALSHKKGRGERLKRFPRRFPATAFAHGLLGHCVAAHKAEASLLFFPDTFYDVSAPPVCVCGGGEQQQTLLERNKDAGVAVAAASIPAG